MKKTISFILGALLIISCSTLYADDGLVLYFPFDSAPQNGVILDASGNTNNGTIQINGPVYKTDGKQGGALEFDGADDYIFVARTNANGATSLDVAKGGAFTLAAWYKVTHPVQSLILGWRDNFPNASACQYGDGVQMGVNINGFQWSGKGTGVNVIGGPCDYNRDKKVISVPDQNLNEWHHLTLTYDPSAGARLYLDGHLVAEKPNLNGYSPLTSGDLLIGKSRSTPFLDFKGLLDEIRIYNRALSEQEILALTGPTTPSSPLVAYYSFDNAPENGIIFDNSGNQNNGSIQPNGPVFKAQGKMGGAMEFDGIDDYIFIPRNAADSAKFLDVGAGGKFTLAAWYKAAHPIQSLLLGWRDNFPNNSVCQYGDGVQMGINIGGFQWGGKGTGVNIIGGLCDYNRDKKVISIADQNLNEWHHLAITFDQTIGAKLYLDGQLAAQNNNLTGYTPLTSGDLLLGKATGAPFLDFKGLLDDVRIYNIALTQQDIKGLVNPHGFVFQNFEEKNGTIGNYCEGINGSSADVSQELVHQGSRACRQTPNGGNWGGVRIKPSNALGYVDFDALRNDRMTFWIYPQPSAGPNNIAVKFFDDRSYASGFEVWTTQKAQPQQWTQLSVLFSQLPSNFNLSHVTQIEFVNYHSALYDFDDIEITSNDRQYQSFELTPIDNPPSSYPGLLWSGGDAHYSQAGEPVYEGQHSYKLSINAESVWFSALLMSQERRCQFSSSCASQDYWHVDLNPQLNDRISLQINSQSINKMDNNLAIQLYDHDQHATDNTKAEIWMKKTAEYGQWTEYTILFQDLLKKYPTLHLNDLNKIQLLFYWPGNYYIDDIRATRATSSIDKDVLPSGTVSWTKQTDAGQYELQESSTGPHGPWTTVYHGPETTWTLNHFMPSWLRVRWQTAVNPQGPAAYISQWSDVVAYQTPPILIKHSRLMQGSLEWSAHSLATQYKVEHADHRNGTWTPIYTGPQKTISLSPSDLGKWYRVSAVGPKDTSALSPALLYDPNGFVQAAGTNLREQQGVGDIVQLKGVNLGNYLLLEPWMMGETDEFTKGRNDPEAFKGKYYDDWTIRKYLDNNAQHTLDVYQQAYIKNNDLDNIMRMGFNFIRLPIYYRDICDLSDNGLWTCGNNFNFATIDRIVEACADRGIYVLLDLHGAPGAQGPEFHTGRSSYEQPAPGFKHQLFDPANPIYRQRTQELWEKIAQHYLNNTTIVGYDLLNEPTGFEAYSHVGDFSLLHGIYTDLYSTIRNTVGDNHHVIVMEGAWNWDSLPNPQTKGWDNVMYQFHYYCWQPKAGETPIAGETCYGYDPGRYQGITLSDVTASHIAFINKKVSDSRQQIDNVPVLIGEFNGFDIKDVWAYYLTQFNAQKYNWSLWSYKTYASGNWGLFNQSYYDEDLPDFENDNPSDLERKLQKYDTATHHAPNQTLIQTITENLNRTDYDNDGLSDEVDVNPAIYSADFNDHRSVVPTTGTILNRGDQYLSITDDPDPNQGVTISAAASGGATPAYVSVCSGSATYTLTAGDILSVTCGSVSTQVISGPIEVTFISKINTTATAVLQTKDKIIFYPDTLTYINTGTNPISIVFKGIMSTILPGKTAHLNHAPIANAGMNQKVQCHNPRGSRVILDGSKSADPDQDPLSFRWFGPNGTISTPTQRLILPLGKHQFTLTVKDPYGAEDSDKIKVKIIDTIAPGLKVEITPHSLWPPNNKMVKVTPSITVTDACDANPKVELESIVMIDNKETTIFDAKHPIKTKNIIIDNNGQILLKAQNPKRVYIFRYTATDRSGNKQKTHTQIRVSPH
jgi:aryl-phospho-beta-D-glucosidase BglC (GH1 family)